MKPNTHASKDPVEIYRAAFPRAFVGLYYADLIAKHVTDADLWQQVIEDEKYRCRIEKKRPHPVPWLIESFQRMERSIREIETPPDRLTTHREAEINPGKQMSPKALRDLLSPIDYHPG